MTPTEALNRLEAACASADGYPLDGWTSEDAMQAGRAICALRNLSSGRLLAEVDRLRQMLRRIENLPGVAALDEAKRIAREGLSE